MSTELSILIFVKYCLDVAVKVYVIFFFILDHTHDAQGLLRSLQCGITPGGVWGYHRGCWGLNPACKTNTLHGVPANSPAPFKLAD